MKWYRWKDELINLDNIINIYKSQVSLSLIFNFSDEMTFLMGYESEKQRDEEFEMICDMLGCKEKEYSRCC